MSASTDGQDGHGGQVVFVAGAGRSGTSTMVGLLRILGLHVPQPEVAPDESNPKGFGEPQWIVDEHERMLRQTLVQVADARPEAFDLAGKVALDDAEVRKATTWLRAQVAEQPFLVVKDPRLSWFLPLWRQVVANCGVPTGVVTMLRPPAEVAGSRQAYYGSRMGAAHLAASWLNVMLRTELETRPDVGTRRAFVRYADLLGDWMTSTNRVGEALGLEQLTRPGPDQLAEGNRFVDPSLRRMTQTLDDLDLPARLHELVAESWSALDALADPGGDTPAAYPVLDQLRAAYVDLYAESEAISRSSAVAARHEGHRQADRAHAAARAEEAAGAPRLADRVPHGLRAMVPASVRRGLRRLAHLER